ANDTCIIIAFEKPKLLSTALKAAPELINASAAALSCALMTSYRSVQNIKACCIVKPFVKSAASLIKKGASYLPSLLEGPIVIFKFFIGQSSFLMHIA